MRIEHRFSEDRNPTVGVGCPFHRGYLKPSKTSDIYTTICNGSKITVTKYKRNNYMLGLTIM